MEARQVDQLHLTGIFHGGAAPDSVRGAHAKRRAAAYRAGAGLVSPGREIAEGGGPAAAMLRNPAAWRREGKRTYPNAPTMQSIVDQIVFGRDIDESGETQFDEDFMAMFREAAGAKTGVLAQRPQGLRPFPNAPTTQSVVDQVVFGRDVDFSGETQFDDDYMAQHYSGSAGRPTVTNRRR